MVTVDYRDITALSYDHFRSPKLSRDVPFFSASSLLYHLVVVSVDRRRAAAPNYPSPRVALRHGGKASVLRAHHIPEKLSFNITQLRGREGGIG